MSPTHNTRSSSHTTAGTQHHSDVSDPSIVDDQCAQDTINILADHSEKAIAGSKEKQDDVHSVQSNSSSSNHAMFNPQYPPTQYEVSTVNNTTTNGDNPHSTSDQEDANNKTQSNGDDETTTFLSSVFKVMENYDDGFLDSGRVTTISDLIASREEQQTDRLSMESFHNAKKSKRESPFLFAMLMHVSVPSMKTSDLSFPTFKKN